MPVRAELQVGETSSRFEAMTVGKPAGRVLLLEDQANQADALADVLQNEGLLLERRPSSSLPPSANALGDFDAVVLVNTPATSVTLDQQRTLQSFVQETRRRTARRRRPAYVLARRLSGHRAGRDPAGRRRAADRAAARQPGAHPGDRPLGQHGRGDRRRGGWRDQDRHGASGGDRGGSAPATRRHAGRGRLRLSRSSGWSSRRSLAAATTSAARRGSSARSGRAAARASSRRCEAAYEAVAQIDAPLRHVVLLTDGESSDRGYEALIERMRPANDHAVHAGSRLGLGHATAVVAGPSGRRTLLLHRAQRADPAHRVQRDDDSDAQRGHRRSRGGRRGRAEPAAAVALGRVPGADRATSPRPARTARSRRSRPNAAIRCWPTGSTGSGRVRGLDVAGAARAGRASGTSWPEAGRFWSQVAALGAARARAI